MADPSRHVPREGRLMESSVQALQARNDRAAERELADLRLDTVKGLRFTFGQEGESGIVRLLIEAGIVAPSAASLRKVAA